MVGHSKLKFAMLDASPASLRGGCVKNRNRRCDAGVSAFDECKDRHRTVHDHDGDCGDRFMG